jgi:hypothetical protein
LEPQDVSFAFTNVTEAFGNENKMIFFPRERKPDIEEEGRLSQSDEYEKTFYRKFFEDSFIFYLMFFFKFTVEVVFTCL